MESDPNEIDQIEVDDVIPVQSLVKEEALPAIDLKEENEKIVIKQNVLHIEEP